MINCKYLCDKVCCNDSCHDMFGDYPHEEYCKKCEQYEKGEGVDDKSGVSN